MKRISKHQKKRKHKKSIENSNTLTSSSHKEKPSENSYSTGRWKQDEHLRFLEALYLFGSHWRRIQEYIRTRSTSQTRSHAQKFFFKITKDAIPLLNSDALSHLHLSSTIFNEIFHQIINQTLEATKPNIFTKMFCYLDKRRIELAGTEKHHQQCKERFTRIIINAISTSKKIKKIFAGLIQKKHEKIKEKNNIKNLSTENKKEASNDIFTPLNSIKKLELKPLVNKFDEGEYSLNSHQLCEDPLRNVLSLGPFSIEDNYYQTSPIEGTYFDHEQFEQ